MKETICSSTKSAGQINSSATSAQVEEVGREFVSCFPSVVCVAYRTAYRILPKQQDIKRNVWNEGNKCRIQIPLAAHWKTNASTSRLKTKTNSTQRAPDASFRDRREKGRRRKTIYERVPETKRTELEDVRAYADPGKIRPSVHTKL